jgi:histidinol-phosphatase (PHP family)
LLIIPLNVAAKKTINFRPSLELWNMPWVNYHSHSLFCDGKALPEEFIKPAVGKGFPAFGYSSHAPVPFASRWNMAADKLPGYRAELARIKSDYADRIEVYAGLEVDYIEGLWGYRQSGLHQQGFDYCIGSVHYIGRFPDGSHFCFDGEPDAFFKGIGALYHHDFTRAIRNYYQSVMRMVEVDKPDIIGHLDKIKMHNSVKPYLNEEETWYIDLVEETLEVIRKHGSILEVNTRGLYKHNPPLLYPASWVLKRALEKKIPVMLNSDSHHPDEIESGFDYASAILREIGFRTLRVLLNNQWQDVAFVENGLIV